MLIAEKIIARFVAYCFVAVLFLFANHCFLEDACASLGKVDLGGHPVGDSSTEAPCHEHSSESEREGEACPIIGISLHKNISVAQDLQDNLELTLKISSWVIALSQAPVVLLDQVKSGEDDLDHLNLFNSTVVTLNSAPQAPPVS